MEFASDRGAKVIAITDSPLSPLAGPADYLLMARSDMASIVDALVAPFSLIKALIVAAALHNREDVTHIFQQLEDIWDEYKVYEKVDERSEKS